MIYMYCHRYLRLIILEVTGSDHARLSIRMLFRDAVPIEFFTVHGLCLSPVSRALASDSPEKAASFNLLISMASQANQHFIVLLSVIMITPATFFSLSSVIGGVFLFKPTNNNYRSLQSLPFKTIIPRCEVAADKPLLQVSRIVATCILWA